MRKNKLLEFSGWDRHSYLFNGNNEGFSLLQAERGGGEEMLAEGCVLDGISCQFDTVYNHLERESQSRIGRPLGRSVGELSRLC